MRSHEAAGGKTEENSGKVFTKTEKYDIIKIKIDFWRER